MSKKKKINEDVAVTPNIKVGDYIELPVHNPKSVPYAEKVTEVFDEPGLPKDWRGVKGLGPSVAMKVFPKEIIDNAYWFVVDHKYAYPFFPETVKKVAPPKKQTYEEGKNMPEIYDGYGNADKAPAKVGDEVIDVNTKGSKPTKVIEIVYGYPEKSKADHKPSAEQIQAIFGSGGRKMWWIVVDGNVVWGKVVKGTAAVPYGEDGFMQVEDAKSKGYISEVFPYRQHALMTRAMGNPKIRELTAVTNIVGGRSNLMKIISDSDLPEPIYDKLFQYYTSPEAGGEMPYGTAKARTGDPIEWILNRLDSLVSKKEDSPKQAVTEARSLLKDEPTKDEDTGRKTIVPKCAECGKELKVEGNIAMCENPECSLKGKKITVNPEKKQEAPKMNEATFTKQHYIAIANILKAAKTKDDIVSQLVAFFKKDNPLFDAAKFTAYVGPEHKPTSPQE